MRLEKAPLEISAEDYGKLSQTYESTINQLGIAKKQIARLETVRPSVSTMDHPSLDQVRKWKTFIEGYNLSTDSSVLGKVKGSPKSSFSTSPVFHSRPFPALKPARPVLRT